MRANGTNGRASGFAANENAVAAGDHAAHLFARSRIDAKRFVADALVNLETPGRFAGGLVNVSRHGGTLHRKRGCVLADGNHRKQGEIARPGAGKKDAPETDSGASIEIWKIY